MSKYRFCSQEEYHDACMCQLQRKFDSGAEIVKRMPNWEMTKWAMETFTAKVSREIYKINLEWFPEWEAKE